MNIFDGIDTESLKLLTNCLQAVEKTYKKEEIIFDIGDEITAVAYIIEGAVQLSKDDYEGGKVILEHISEGEIFAQSMVCAGVEKSSVCAIAIEDTRILFMDFKRILSICSNSCPFHKRLVENIIKNISLKNMMLQERIELLAKKTLRERILYMLLKEKRKTGKNIFEIPYSREQMAQYLAADRSALSRELSNMKCEKIIDFHKNSFKLL